MDWPSDQSVVKETTLTTPHDNELATLTHSIIEWKKCKEEVDLQRQHLREVGKKMKVLQEIILRVMKSHNIGALDLKNSGGRVLFKKESKKASLGQKNMEKLFTSFLESSDKAKELIQFLDEHREKVIKESIHYEKV